MAGRPSLPGGPRCREALVAGRPSLPGGPRCEALLPGGLRCREALADRPLPGSPAGRPWSFIMASVKEAYVSFRPLWVLTGRFGSPYGEGTLRGRPLTGGLYSPS